MEWTDELDLIPAVKELLNLVKRIREIPKQLY